MLEKLFTGGDARSGNDCKLQQGERIDPIKFDHKVNLRVPNEIVT